MEEVFLAGEVFKQPNNHLQLQQNSRTLRRIITLNRLPHILTHINSTVINHLPHITKHQRKHQLNHPVIFIRLLLYLTGNPLFLSHLICGKFMEY
jgi:hypothetical protein